jgi:hypothetical protein
MIENRKNLNPLYANRARNRTAICTQNRTRPLTPYKGPITLAFWMCSLDVQRTVCCNDMRFRCAAKPAAYLRNATPCCTPRCTPCCMQRCMRFQCHFLLSTYFLTSILKKPRSAACSVMWRSCSATLRCRACCNVCCIQCNWSQILLHIKNASHCSRRLAAHPNCTFKTQV